jgi:hypothetical protein
MRGYSPENAVISQDARRIPLLDHATRQEIAAFPGMIRVTNDPPHEYTVVSTRSLVWELVLWCGLRMMWWDNGSKLGQPVFYV